MIKIKNHYTEHKTSTIAAIATPTGEGGIAIIRLSGSDAIAIADAIFSGNVCSYKTHTLHFGRILETHKEIIDEGMLTVMRSPHSYTGEDVVEIHCHGGSLVSKRVLQRVINAGAKTAEPGEFTFRAFMNGKLDLLQAEAVQELIMAKNELALSSANKQLHGKLSKKITSIKDALIDIAAILEAWVDFPEEGIEVASMEQIILQLLEVKEEIHKLLLSFDKGKIIHAGLSICLIGSPNVGKSSLMNAILSKDRAIVTNTPGTTRDIIEEELRLGGINFRLIDTAGIRQTDEEVEMEGIKRSKHAMSDADIILLVLDRSRSLSKDDLKLIDDVDVNKTIILWNKEDLPMVTHRNLQFKYMISISAKEGWGLDSLEKIIGELIWTHGPPSKEEVMITNIRHKEALDESASYLTQIIQGLEKGLSPEFLSFDIRQSLSCLGRIIGFEITEDVLAAIFSKFCIGK